MRLNHSFVDKQNSDFTFSYKQRCENRQNKNNHLFQSVIMTKPSNSREPLALVTSMLNYQHNTHSNRGLAQSMLPEGRSIQMLRSFYQVQISVENESQSGLGGLSQFRPRSIAQEIEETSIEDFQVGELLGKGARGNVYICRHKQTGFFFALKKIKKKTVTDFNQFIRSLKIQMFLDQPNIVKLYSVFDDSDHIYLLMELCIDGTLKSQAKKIKNPKQIKRFLLGIAYGLRHLHRRNIRHGDIKLENIICSYGMAKISDFDCISFGKCQNPFKKNNNYDMPGSPLYFSPQMLRESILGLNDDVWSLGIICYQILCGYYPFEISSPSQLSNILVKEMKPFPSSCDSFLSELTRKMLSKRACQRQKLSEIIIDLQRD